MKKTLICTLMLMGATAFAQAPTAELTVDEKQRQAAEQLLKSYEALPFRLIHQPGRAIGLEWKDGSRVAEMEIGTNKFEKRVGIEVVGNTCGQKQTGHLCDAPLAFTFNTTRLVWKKHPDPARVGQVVKSDVYPFDSLSQGPSMVDFTPKSNAGLVDPIGDEILPMHCKNWNWLPPSPSGRLKIASWSYDDNELEGNPLAPQNQTQTAGEFHDLTALLSPNGSFRIEKPENPFDHLGYDNTPVTSNQFAGGALLAIDRNTVWQIGQSNGELCKVRLKPMLDLNSFVAILLQSPRSFEPATPERVRQYSQRRIPHLSGQVKTYVSFFESLEFDRPVFRNWMPEYVGLELHLLAEFSWLKTSNGVKACGPSNLDACKIEAENLQ